MNKSKRERKNGIWKECKKHKIKLLMIAPAVLYFFVLAYLPMGGMVMAFKSYNYTDGIFGSPWVGFKNFSFFFSSGQAFNVTKNTLLYNAVFMIVNNAIEIVLAIIIAELAGRKLKRFFQSIILLPYFISWVVVGAFVYNLFNFEFGSINTFLQSIGMQPIDVYSNPKAWVYIIVIFSAWKWIGYGSVFYLAAIYNIDNEMYEAADIDGANIFRKIRHITFPALVPTLIILLLLSIGNIARGDFQMFYQIVGDNGLVLNTTDVIDTLVIRSLLNMQEYGMSAAVGFYQSLLCFAIIMFANTIIKRIDKEYSLF